MTAAAKVCIDNYPKRIQICREMHARNSPYRSYQRFCHLNEAKWSFCIKLTLKPVLHVVLNKKKK